MAHAFAEIVFTPRVKALQAEDGSRASYARFEGGPAHHDRLGAREARFIEERDSFYLATVGETGWPYIQHRGGPAGFIRALDEETFGFADFRGNRQHVSEGNLAGDGRAAFFFMDYANQTRLKLLGRVEVTTDPAVLERLSVPGYPAKVERAFLVRVAGFDWNCPQHITPRFTLEEVQQATAPLRARVAELEARLAARPGGA
ncbi:MAG: pyridoxamine 5'-phosphate oxidase family protein [Acetobacteraceae bacterium]|nr:pyridoxamine 5'-phosphate oxidase family protein [Acetobacteraceae bacterium]